MKHIYYIFFLSLLFLQCKDAHKIEESNQSSLQLSAWEQVDTSCTIGLVALDMERIANFTVEVGEYLFIEDFINLLQPLIPSKTNYSKKEALEILQTIDYAIRRMRTQQLEYESSFSTCIRYRIFDCDINSLLYLTIGEHLGLPIYGLVLPKHMLVLWKDEGQEIYWETTEGQVRSKEFYLEKYGIEDQQSGKNMLLSSLTKKDLLAVISFNMGKAYADKGIFEEGIRYSLEATELRKDWYSPYSTIATIYQNMELPENALYYSRKAIQCFRRDVESHRVMAWAYTVLGCDTEAEEVFKSLSVEAWGAR